MSDMLLALEAKRRMIWRFIQRAEQGSPLMDMLIDDLERIEAKITQEGCCND